MRFSAWSRSTALRMRLRTVSFVGAFLMLLISVGAMGANVNLAQSAASSTSPSDLPQRFFPTSMWSRSPSFASAGTGRGTAPSSHLGGLRPALPAPQQCAGEAVARVPPRDRARRRPPADSHAGHHAPDDHRPPGTGARMRAHPRAGLVGRLCRGRRGHPLRRGADPGSRGRRARDPVDLRPVAPASPRGVRRTCGSRPARGRTHFRKTEDAVTRLSFLIVLFLGEPPQQAPVDFDRDIRPIFKASCLKCHGGEGKAKGQLRLDQKAAAFRGGAGGKAIVPGKSSESPLYKLLVDADEDVRMPQKAPRLGEAQIGMIRRWIDEGARWPEEAAGGELRHWSLRPLIRPAVPG